MLPPGSSCKGGLICKHDCLAGSFFEGGELVQGLTVVVIKVIRLLEKLHSYFTQWAKLQMKPFCKKDA